MGQLEIYKILKSNPNKFFTAEELSDITNIGVISIRNRLKEMLKYGDIIVEKKIYFSRKMQKRNSILEN